MNKLSIIVPVYNEEKTISTVIKNIQKIKIPNWKTEIIIVNDGSTDSTPILLKKLKQTYSKLKILTHKKNRGKGASIITALSAVKSEAIIIQDADLEYNPNEIKKLVSAYEKNGGAIFGSRNLKPKRKGYTHYVFGVWILTNLTNVLYSASLTDIYTCYKLLNTKMAKSLQLESTGFEIEAEIVAKLLKQGIKITEIPIIYNPRTFSEGKKINWKDGLIGLITLMNYKF